MFPSIICHAGAEAITVARTCQQISEGKQAVPTRLLDARFTPSEPPTRTHSLVPEWTSIRLYVFTAIVRLFEKYAESPHLSAFPRFRTSRHLFDMMRSAIASFAMQTRAHHPAWAIPPAPTAGERQKVFFDRRLGRTENTGIASRRHPSKLLASAPMPEPRSDPSRRGKLDAMSCTPTTTCHSDVRASDRASARERIAGKSGHKKRACRSTPSFFLSR